MDYKNNTDMYFFIPHKLYWTHCVPFRLDLPFATFDIFFISHFLPKRLVMPLVRKGEHFLVATAVTKGLNLIFCPVEI